MMKPDETIEAMFYKFEKRLRQFSAGTFPIVINKYAPIETKEEKAARLKEEEKEKRKRAKIEPYLIMELERFLPESVPVKRLSDAKYIFERKRLSHIEDTEIAICGSVTSRSKDLRAYFESKDKVGFINSNYRTYRLVVDDGTGALEVRLQLIYPKDRREALRLVFKEFKEIVVKQLRVMPEGIMDKTRVPIVLDLLRQAEDIVKLFTKVMVNYFYSRLSKEQKGRHHLSLKEIYMHGFSNWFSHCRRLYLEIGRLSKLLSRERAKLEKLEIPYKTIKYLDERVGKKYPSIHEERLKREAEMKSWKERIARLKKAIEESPDDGVNVKEEPMELDVSEDEPMELAESVNVNREFEETTQPNDEEGNSEEEVFEPMKRDQSNDQNAQNHLSSKVDRILEKKTIPFTARLINVLSACEALHKHFTKIAIEEKSPYTVSEELEKSLKQKQWLWDENLLLTIEQWYLNTGGHFLPCEPPLDQATEGLEVATTSTTNAELQEEPIADDSVIVEKTMWDYLDEFELPLDENMNDLLFAREKNCIKRDKLKLRKRRKYKLVGKTRTLMLEKARAARIYLERLEQTYSQNGLMEQNLKPGDLVHLTGYLRLESKQRWYDDPEPDMDLSKYSLVLYAETMKNVDEQYFHEYFKNWVKYGKFRWQPMEVIKRRMQRRMKRRHMKKRVIKKAVRRLPKKDENVEV